MVNAPLHDDDDMISSFNFFFLIFSFLSLESIRLWHSPKAECDLISRLFQVIV